MGSIEAGCQTDLLYEKEQEPSVEETMVWTAAEERDLLRMYLIEAGAFPVLTVKENQNLVDLIRAGRQTGLDSYTGDFTPEKEEFDEAVRKLLFSNLRLVVCEAALWSWTGIPLMDLIREGNEQLLKEVAKQKLDRRRGLSFVKRLRPRIYAYAAEMGALEGMPDDVHKSIIPRIEMLEVELRPLLGRKRGKTRIYPPEFLIKYVEEAQRLAKDFFVGASYYQHEHPTQIRSIFQEEEAGASDPVEIVFQRQLREAIQRALSGLSPDERKILTWRYALEGGDELSRPEIAKIMNITPKEVLRIELCGFRKLLWPRPASALRQFSLFLR